ncbi:MAG: hypothetical protein ABJB86_09830, partial [Bacteroidota bacterium]
LALCMIPLMAHAGNSYTLSATRGDIVISSLSTSPEMQPGDTLFIPADGKYTSVQYRRLKGDSLHKIYVIWLPGSQVKATSFFQQLTNFSLSFVIIENMLHYNFYGTSKFSYGVHDVEFKNCQWINPQGAYKDQPPIQWDDPYSPVSMVFTGKKSQTFYNITYNGCMFDGFKNVNVIQISTNWNTNNNEIRRSMALDFKFIADTFQNVTTTAPVTVGAIVGTGFGCTVNHCVFKNIVGPGSSQNSHSTSIMWYGSIDVSDCFQENSYAQLLLCIPRGWSGLPGYLDKNTACRAWQNIIHNNLSFSAFGFNQDIGGNRNDLNGIHVVKATCIYNTVYRTKRSSYNGPNYGFVADNVHQDSLDCSYNLVVAPETDYAFDINRGYIVAVVLQKPKHQVTVGNKVFKSWARNIIEDTIHYRPGNPALIANGTKTGYSFITTDFYGNKIPVNGPAYAGAVEADPVTFKSLKRK